MNTEPAPRILLLNGPNLNLLGTRKPEVYGTQTLSDIEQACAERAHAAGFGFASLQSNHEGELVDAIQQAQGVFAGIVYNPGAHAHYSYALRDAIEAVSVPVVEVHISDIHMREAFRNTSVLEPVCFASICGHGAAGYLEAIDLIQQYVKTH